MAGRLARDLINLIFPPVCANCRKVGALLCGTCRQQITWMEEPVCTSCGRPALEPATICLSCREQPIPLQPIRAAVPFEGVVRAVIHQMKYNGYYALARP
ncbi:MAG: double zinc ribbon domain-containing protein, partial [Chloroflexota bacterium]